MSGGTWDYVQYRLEDVMDSIRREIADYGKTYTKEEIERDGLWAKPGDLKGYIEDEESLDLMKEALYAIARAQVYIQRCDWFLAGDDGCTSFKARTREDLEEIEKARNDGTLFKPRYGDY